MPEGGIRPPSRHWAGSGRMPVRLEARVDPASLQRVVRELRQFPRNVQKRAMMSALGKTATWVKTHTVRTVRSEINVRRERLAGGMARGGIEKSRLRSSSGGREMGYTVSTTGRRISLAEFAAKQIRKGVSYRIGAAGAVSGKARGLVPGAFKATMASGHEGVWYRWGPKRKAQRGRYAGKMRQEIREYFGPSVPHVLIKRPEMASIERDAAAVLEKNIDSQIRRFLARGPGG